MVLKEIKGEYVKELMVKKEFCQETEKEYNFTAPKEKLGGGRYGRQQCTFLFSNFSKFKDISTIVSCLSFF